MQQMPTAVRRNLSEVYLLLDFNKRQGNDGGDATNDALLSGSLKRRSTDPSSPDDNECQGRTSNDQKPAQREKRSVHLQWGGTAYGMGRHYPLGCCRVRVQMLTPLSSIWHTGALGGGGHVATRTPHSGTCGF